MTSDYIKIKAFQNNVLELLWKLHNPIFGGSIMFNAYGLLSREPNDIDVFTCQYPYNLMSNNEWKRIDVSTTSPYVYDIFGVPLKRYAFTRNDVHICVFVIPEEQHKHEIKYSPFLQRFINCQLPMFGIEAKRQYFENYGIIKHGEDLVEIHHRLHGLPYP